MFAGYRIKGKKDSTQSTADLDDLSTFINELKTTNEAQRLKATEKLADWIAQQFRELASDEIKQLGNDLSNKIFGLISSAQDLDKIAGILVISCLIEKDVGFDENASTKITRLSNYIHQALSSNNHEVLALAAQTLGKLVRFEGTLTAEIFDREVKKALEWLKQGDKVKEVGRRQAAVFVLKELALNAPPLFYVHVVHFFELIWLGLNDTKLQVREGAGDALRAALDLIRERKSTQRNQWYDRLWQNSLLQLNQRANNLEVMHGSLIAIGELVRNASDFMKTRFKDICETVLRYKDFNKGDKGLIRRVVVSLLPLLAKLSPEEFKNYIGVCMNHLMEMSTHKKEDNDRGAAYLAIGNIALATKEKAHLKPFLVRITGIIKTAIVSKKSYATEALSCIGMLAAAVGNEISPMLPDLIPLMFQAGWSENLTNSLTTLANNVPSVRPTIQEGLLHIIAYILTKKPFPGSFSDVGNTHISSSRKSGQFSNLYQKMGQHFLATANCEENTILALQTLGTFGFPKEPLLDFVRDNVLNFVDDDSIAIRSEAALCCAALVRPSKKNESLESATIGEVIEKLLVVGIADPDPAIRKIVLSALDEKFDIYLAQAINLRSLFIALNDEVFAIRELVIGIIGRLSIRNPAYVMPSLRKTLVQLLTELEFSGDARNKEESSYLLRVLIRSSKQLIKPYVSGILKSLLPKLKDPSDKVATAALAVLGELARVAGRDMQSHMHEVIPFIIEHMQDQSSNAKREIAVRALGQFSGATGCVISFKDYPSLMELLLGMVKAERMPTIRRELLRTLGSLGALDPYKYKTIQMELRKKQEGSEQKRQEMEILAGMGKLSPSSDQFPTIVAAICLMRILRDPSLSVHHTQVINTTMSIISVLSQEAIAPIVPHVMPAFLAVLNASDRGFRNFVFKQLKKMVLTCKDKIRGFLNQVFACITEYWEDSIDVILPLVEEVSFVLEDDFKVYLPDLIPLLLSVLSGCTTTLDWKTVSSVLHTLEVFGKNLDDYLHLVIPALMKLVDQKKVPLNLKEETVITLGRLAFVLDFSDYASRISHPLARILSDSSEATLHSVILDALSVLVYQLGADYAIVIPMINKVLATANISHPIYEELVSQLLKNEMMELPEDFLKRMKSTAAKKHKNKQKQEALQQKLSINEAKLAEAWITSQRTTKDDWIEWMRKFSVELLRESPSHALRCCLSLAQVYHPLATDLFTAAFITCWNELQSQAKDNLIQNLKTALLNTSLPPEITQILLNQAEFLERDDKPLPIDYRTLGERAARCHAYAKALHYKEIEFLEAPNDSNIETLIHINTQLQLPEAAHGVVTLAQQQHDVELKSSWYEKLERWDKALAAYEKQTASDTQQEMEIIVSRMKCLNALGRWGKLATLADSAWTAAQQSSETAQIAKFGAAAAWNLGRWDSMKVYVKEIEENTVDGAFYRAVLAMHEEQYAKMQAFIDKSRQLIDGDLTALVGESYSRAYEGMVRVQQLSELEEVIDYKISKDFPARRRVIVDLWKERLLGCQQNVEVWQQVLAVRSLVLPPKQHHDMWLKFASLCRKNGRLQMARKVIVNLLGKDPAKHKGRVPKAAPKIVLSYYKQLWAEGNQKEAVAKLKQFTVEFKGDNEFLANCYLQLGQWQLELADTLNSKVIPSIIASFKAASECGANLYKAWHAWALINFEVLSLIERDTKASKAITKQKIQVHLLPAISGFIRSIQLSPGQSLQDTLRLLSLWFTHGEQRDVDKALVEGFSTVSIDTWLQVIPQIIARIHAPALAVRRLIQQLLINIGRAHPQALVYPLTVASTSQAAERQAPAQYLLDDMKKHSPLLVEQASLVSHELIRISIVWHEQWHEALEEASRLYFNEKNVEAMLQRMAPMHEMVTKGAETITEVTFQHSFGRNLQEAQEWCKKFQKSRNPTDLNQAWDLYYVVFRAILMLLPTMKTFELQYVSPKLLESTDLELAVPGTYRAGAPVVRIASFAPQLTVIASKQRPRKTGIIGSDGVEHAFLLKGHEDLRQDERVMQMFGLVNTLLANDNETSKGHLNISRYSVIPLSPNSGLIGWVPHCETLHDQIANYRKKKNMELKIEHKRFAQEGGPLFEKYPLIHKVEIFNHAIAVTNAQDLNSMLWLKSRNSEVWLDRRTTFTRSLAMMSMVGYILGLGDRHPSNLMLDKLSGKIVHIDFGDCFEVAMHRDKFPEKVPFRLTRMLIKAMEAGGIEGNFRYTCESVMRVLRENKESLMAVLEAFVHDPLINWRLLNTDNQPSDDDTQHSDAGSTIDTIDSLDALSSGKKKIDNVQIETMSVRIPQVLNERAVNVINRVSSKLTGTDFNTEEKLEVEGQVRKLIDQATSQENLSQSYAGWCPFW